MLPAALAAAALAFWAPTPGTCPTGIKVHTVPVVTAKVMRDAHIEWDAAAGTIDPGRIIAFAPQQKGACVVTLNASQWRLLRPQEQCEVMVHEEGHSVMGLGHVNDGRNIMNAEIVDLPWCDALVARQPEGMLERLAARVRRYEKRHRAHLRRSMRRHHHRTIRSAAAASPVTIGAADDMHAGYRPDVPADMAAHGVTWMRLVAYHGDTLERTLTATGQARAAGLRVSVVLTPKYGREPGAGFASWAAGTASRLADAGVERVSLLNEPDLWLPAADQCDTDQEIRQTLRSEDVTSRRVRAWVKVRRWRWAFRWTGRYPRLTPHVRRRPIFVRRRMMATRITRTPTSTENVSLTPRWGCLEIHRARLAASVWRQAIPAVRAAAPGVQILVGETSPVTGVGIFLRALPDRLPQADGWAHHPYPSATVELGLDHAGRLGHPYGLPVYWTEFGTHVRTDEHAQPMAEARANWRHAIREADRLGVLEVDLYGWLATGKGWDTAAEGIDVNAQEDR